MPVRRTETFLTAQAETANAAQAGALVTVPLPLSAAHRFRRGCSDVDKPAFPQAIAARQQLRRSRPGRPEASPSRCTSPRPTACNPTSPTPLACELHGSLRPLLPSRH